jgi:dienelactone hydrolase
MQAVVLVPPRRGDERFPVLVTMHGKGEAAKGVARGARGWIDDYWLPKAMQRLSQPPLSAEDLLGFADAARLERVNAELRRVPYGGMIVVCPYTPDILAGDRAFAAAEPFAHFVVDELLPRVRRELPASPEPAQTGIDGVSLGGRAALLLGLTRPEAFGAVGTLQAAFDRADAAPLASLAARAQQAHPRLAIRLLTSDADYFLPAHRAISAAFATRGVRHALTVVPGPHDYAFNRGPGAFEMLLFHDRALRGQPWLD